MEEVETLIDKILRIHNVDEMSLGDIVVSKKDGVKIQFRHSGLYVYDKQVLIAGEWTSNIEEFLKEYIKRMEHRHSFLTLKPSKLEILSLTDEIELALRMQNSNLRDFPKGIKRLIPVVSSNLINNNTHLDYMDNHYWLLLDYKKIMCLKDNQFVDCGEFEKNGVKISVEDFIAYGEI